MEQIEEKIKYYKEILQRKEELIKQQEQTSIMFYTLSSEIFFIAGFIKDLDI